MPESPDAGTPAPNGSRGGAPGAPGRIDHVFVVYMENQPFDRLFASFPGADGDPHQKHVTTDVPWWPKGIPPFEPTHGVLSWRLRNVWARTIFRGQFLEQDRPLWWRWARDYVLADRHRTQRGPSTPNHMQLFAASSDGLENNPNPYPILRWLQTTPNSKQPPYDIESLPNRLEDAGLRWASYGEFDFNFFTRLADPKNPGKARNVHPNAQFFADAAAGELPAVSWVFPENPRFQDGIESMEWTRQVVDAIKGAPGNLWERSAILITWDDWGGFYDHVDPVPGEAPSGFAQGGRVPLLILSPYVKPGVFHEPTIHASVVAFIEKVFGLAPLNDVDAAANDLMNAFDFSRDPLPAPETSRDLVPLPALRRSFLNHIGVRRVPGHGLAFGA